MNIMHEVEGKALSYAFGGEEGGIEAHFTRNLCECIFLNIFYNIYLRNEFNFWNVHGIMNTSGLVQSK